MTSQQLTYQWLYSKISRLQRESLDVGRDADWLRERLHQTWNAMAAEEREPFLAPGCLDRAGVGAAPPQSQELGNTEAQ